VTGQPPDIAAIEADWARRGFSCEMWTDPPGQVWTGFVHDVDEFVVPLEGGIELEFGGRTLRPAEGEEVFIPAGATHTVRNIGGTVSRWLFGYRRR
jgi:mannose-6-phosphate isomerase-like protein (cupin superfamily)